MKLQNMFAILVLACPVLISCDISSAKDEPTNAELLKEIKGLKAKVAELEAKVSDLESGKEQLPEATKAEIEKHVDSHLLHRIEGYQITEGLRIGTGATFIVQGTIDANNTSKKGEDVTDGSYSIDLEFEKLLGDFGLAFLHLETGDGQGVEDELEVFSNVNRDQDDSDNAVSVTEVWYEHYLFDKQLILTAGKIDPTVYVDQNEIANDETTQFLGRIFRNAATVDFVDNTAGIHGLFTPKEVPWLELEIQVLDGDNDWEDIADHVFATGQVNLKPEFSEFLEGLTGNYRMYVWYKDTNYTKWADPDSQFEHKYGLGLNIDQQITDILTVFGRYGWCDPDVYDSSITSSSGANYSLEHTWSAGCQLNGKPWNREQDHIGVAIGMVVPSDKYEDASPGRKADDEGHVEAYYSWQVNDHFTLSPDLHIIWDPYGKDHIVSAETRDDTITIIGCRGQVDF